MVCMCFGENINESSKTSFDAKSAFLNVYLDQFEIRTFPTPPQTPPQIFAQEPLRPTGLREKKGNGKNVEDATARGNFDQSSGWKFR